MKVKTLLKMATRCKNTDDAKRLLQYMIKVFSEDRLCRHLYVANAYSEMEDSLAFVQFEMNYQISDNYILMLRPEIREAATFAIVVRMHRMNDGLGMCSQDYDIVKGMDEVIQGWGDNTVREVISKAVELALTFHGELIQSVGVEKTIALTTATKMWRKKVGESK